MKRLLKRTAFATFLLMLVFVNAFSQATTKDITDKFFSIYKKNPLQAVDYGFSTNKWMSRKPDDLANAKTKLKDLIALLGDYYGYELLSDKTAGPNIRMVAFIVRYDRQPIRFTFLFYKPKDSWQLNNFSFDQDIDKDLEEATKAYRLKENFPQ
jgi:hypothetical protein